MVSMETTPEPAPAPTTNQRSKKRRKKGGRREKTSNSDDEEEEPEEQARDKAGGAGACDLCTCPSCAWLPPSALWDFDAQLQPSFIHSMASRAVLVDSLDGFYMPTGIL